MKCSACWADCTNLSAKTAAIAGAVIKGRVRLAFMSLLACANFLVMRSIHNVILKATDPPLVALPEPICWHGYRLQRLSTLNAGVHLAC